MSQIATFYSYKGGVGRTFALANVAVLLAKRGQRVLVIDWDLEAPGLHRYFNSLVENQHRATRGLIHLLKQAAASMDVQWEPFVERVPIEDGAVISLISSGDQAADYVELVRNFSWDHFFQECNGGVVLERWRNEWRQNFDFVLLDSRTGITDTGGVCTVFLPDILVLVFSANEQSFEGGLRVALGIQEARRHLGVPRPPVAVLPLLSRFDGRDEIDEAQIWLSRFSRDLKPLYDDWLPRQFEPRQILELTKIPYVTRFSFGEPLAVITHGITDPELPGFYLENVARLLASAFRDAKQILSPETMVETRMAEFRERLTREPLGEPEMSRVLDEAEQVFGQGTQLAGLFHDASIALMRQSQFNAAERFLQRAVSFSETTFGSDQTIPVVVLMDLAQLYRITGRLGDAESTYRHVVQLLESRGDSEDLIVSVASTNLAQVLRDSGRSIEAEQILRRNVELLERLAPHHPLLALSCTNLADLLYRTDPGEAERLFRRAIALQDGMSPFGPSGLARICRRLAVLLERRGEIDEAEHLYRQSAELLDNKGRPGDPNLTRVFNDLGDLLKRSRRVEEAEQIYRRAIERAEASPASGGPPLARTYDSLGQLLTRLGRTDEAERVYREAIEAFQNPPNAAGFYLDRIHTSLADLLIRRGLLDEAEEIYRQLIARLENAGRFGEASLSRAYLNLGNLFNEAGLSETALQTYQRGIDRVEQFARPSDSAFARLYCRAGETLEQMGRSREAENVYQRAIDRIGKVARPTNTLSAIFLNLVRLLTQSERHGEARTILERLAAMKPDKS